MIQVQNLVKTYSNHMAVDHLDFVIEKGQIYGFLGPNGAGKSTTMNIITGYIGATSGTVLVNGIDITKEPEKAKKCIGYLPESPPLYSDMTVMEYLKFVCEIKGIKKTDRQEQIEKVTDMTGIREVESRLIHNLSKGYKQRIGFAQAILGFPEIIVLDEPTVGLDPKQIIEIRDLIRELGKKHTIILSSHILSEVSEVCDQIIIITKGRLVAQDTPENLITLSGNKHKTTMVVKGLKEKIIETIETIEFITEYNFIFVNDGNGYCKVELTASNENDVRDELFYIFANAKLPITEIYEGKVSLEEVFLCLTSDEYMTDDQETEDFKEVNEVEEIKEETEDVSDL